MGDAGRDGTLANEKWGDVMARRCTTVPGFGTCCRAAQQGLTNRPFQMTTHTGAVRCAECRTVASTSRRHPGRTVFQFRWVPGAQCGIGPGGCPALTQPQGAVGGPQGGGIQLQP